MVVPSGDYTTIDSLIRALNLALKDIAVLNYSKFKPITISFAEHIEYLKLSDRLAYMLGFKSGHIFPVDSTAKFPPDMRAGGILSMFILILLEAR